MITPQSVYDLVLRCIGNNTCSVCDLHKPCIGHPCACEQHTPVIDFDDRQAHLPKQWKVVSG